MIIAIEDPSAADVLTLLAQHLEEMNAHCSPESMHALAAHGLRHPSISFWTARRDDGVLMGCGALKALSADHGEIKSMRTAADHRRQGVSAALLETIIKTAQARGMTRLSLETGTIDLFTPARALYSKYGFKQCPPFADYSVGPESTFYTREI